MAQQNWAWILWTVALNHRHLLHHHHDHNHDHDHHCDHDHHGRHAHRQDHLQPAIVVDEEYCGETAQKAEQGNTSEYDVDDDDADHGGDNDDDADHGGYDDDGGADDLR